MDLNRNPISQFDLAKKDPNSSINMEKSFQEVQFLLKSKLNQAIDIQFAKDFHKRGIFKERVCKAAKLLLNEKFKDVKTYLLSLKSGN